MMKKLIALMMVAGMAAQAATLFDLADTNAASFVHDTNGTNSPSPIPNAGSQSVGSGTFAWGDLSSDTTPNRAHFVGEGGDFAAYDWGGDGTFTSNDIDVSSYAEVDIDGQFDGQFNTGSEFSNFFYRLDGGGNNDFGAGVEDTEHNNETADVEDLDVSGASTLVVGFEYNHDGTDNYFNVDWLRVTGVPIPEPTALSLLTLAGAALLRRRR